MTYEKCDLYRPTFRPRTYLYSLPPIGVGSPLVESLTSYIARLAEAHVVTPGVLLTKELYPRASRARSNGQPRTPPGPNYDFLYDARLLNGRGKCAEGWVPVVEALTGQPNLHLLTMLTWKELLSAHGLLRSSRAWCPCCFEEWRRSERAIYDPLLWAIKPVSMCPVHRRSLLETCPHCKRETRALTARSRVGCCARCRQWLGDDGGRMEAAGQELLHQIWVAENVGTLLAWAPSSVHLPGAAALRANLRAAIDDLAEGNESALARTIGMDVTDSKSWITRHGTPRLDSLLQVCWRLGVPLLRFLTERLEAGDPDWEHARAAVKRAGRSTSKRLRQSEVSLALQAALRAPRPPALSELAKQLGLKYANSLRRRDRRACVQLTKCRHQLLAQTKPSSRTRRPRVSKERIIRRLEMALHTQPPPSVRSVVRELGLHEERNLYSQFPALCQRLVAARRRYGELRRRRVDRVLQRALVENPPPTLGDLANRLGYKSPTPFRHYHLVSCPSDS